MCRRKSYAEMTTNVNNKYINNIEIVTVYFHVTR